MIERIAYSALRTIFLDFDGVLDSSSAVLLMPNVPLTELRQAVPYRGLFRYAEPLAGLLATAGKVEVVISSSWRHSLSDDELRAVGPELAPWMASALDRRIQHRGVAVKAWLQLNSPSDYRVIDDDTLWFDERFVDTTRLIVTNESDRLAPRTHALNTLSSWLNESKELE